MISLENKRKEVEDAHGGEHSVNTEENKEGAR